MSKKVLIMSASTGGGHNRAAKAMKEEIEKRCINGEYITCEIVDSLKLINTTMDKIISSGYEKSAKYTPKAWGGVYKISDANIMSKHEFKGNLFNSLLSSRLKKLLSKQGFISITIDPYIPVNIRNKDGKIININNEANISLENLKASGYNYLGPNLFFESEKPRFEAIITLNQNIKDIYQLCEKRVRHKIKKAIRSGIEIYKGSEKDLPIFYDLIKKKYNKPLNYYIDLYNNFNTNIDLYFAKLNTETFVITSRLQYEREIETNNNLANKIQNTTKINVKNKLINEKMESDKLVNTYKKNLVWATNLLKANPEGLIIGTTLNLSYDNVCYLIIEGFNQNFKTLNSNYLIKWKMINDYKNRNFKYINLNAVSGEFSKATKYSGLNEMKLGFNSLITEYVGEFELIISPLPYNLYKNLNKEKKK